MEIYKQLFNFQKSIRTVDKNSQGYGYKYASLDNIVAKITPYLEENNLGYTHIFEGDTIICVLFNTEGEKIESKLNLSEDATIKMSASQQQGSAITYARRYTLSAILGLVTDEDTDGATKTHSDTKSVSKGQDTDDKPWLNLTDKQGNKTERCTKMKEFMFNNGLDGKAMVEQARKKYKVSNETKDIILSMEQDVSQDMEAIASSVFDN